jgi:hypothetical protein
MNISVRKLKLASQIYLTIPVYVFMLAWVKIWIALPVCVLLLWSNWEYIKKLWSNTDEKVTFNIFHLFAIISIGVLWISLSGIGGFGMLLHDHQKIYAITKDIIEQSFPITYVYEGQHYYLSAYIAYHIVSPILAGWISYDAANVFLFVYATIGVLLGLIWFSILSNNKLVYSTIFFILVGGIDVAGFLFHSGFTNGLKEILSGTHIQFYWYNSLDIQKYLLYHGNTNVLFWAGPHAVPCWVASGIFFYDVLIKKQLFSSPIYLFPLIFWSPFMLLGMFPYFVYVLFKERKQFAKYLQLGNFLLLPAFLLLLWFVNSVSVEDIHKGFYFLPFVSVKYFVKDGFRLIWFLLFEVGVWLGFLWLTKRKGMTDQERNILIILSIVLCLIPMYRLGKYNDWVQRVSMPSLFLMWILVLQGYQNIKRGALKILFFLLFIIGAADSLSLLNLSYTANGLTFDYHPMKYEDIKSMPETSVENGWPLDQILAKDEPSFFKYIAKSK